MAKRPKKHIETQRLENNTDFQQRWGPPNCPSRYDICACRHLESLSTPDCLGIVLQCWWPELRMTCCPFHSFEGFDMGWPEGSSTSAKMDQSPRHCPFCRQVSNVPSAAQIFFLIKLGKCMERSGQQNLCNG